MAWETLLAISRQARAWAQEDATGPPDACPVCGTPLRSGPGGVWFCEFGGAGSSHTYRWPVGS